MPTSADEIRTIFFFIATPTPRRSAELYAPVFWPFFIIAQKNQKQKPLKASAGT